MSGIVSQQFGHEFTENCHRSDTGSSPQRVPRKGATCDLQEPPREPRVTPAGWGRPVTGRLMVFSKDCSSERRRYRPPQSGLPKHVS
jgi:hypothetical protein